MRLVPVVTADGLCQVPACGRERRDRRYCRAHYERVRALRSGPSFDEAEWRASEPAIEGPGQVSLHGVSPRAVAEVLHGLQQRTFLRAARRRGVGRLAQVRGDPGRRQLLGDMPAAIPGRRQRRLRPRRQKIIGARRAARMCRADALPQGTATRASPGYQGVGAAAPADVVAFECRGLGHAMAVSSRADPHPPGAATVAVLLAGRAGCAARRPRSLRAHSPGMVPSASASASILASRV